MIELSSERKALIESLLAYKPPALSCTAFIFKKNSFNKNAKRKASAAERLTIKLRITNINRSVQIAKLRCISSILRCTASFCLLIS